MAITSLRMSKLHLIDTVKTYARRFFLAFSSRDSRYSSVISSSESLSELSDPLKELDESLEDSESESWSSVISDSSQSLRIVYSYFSLTYSSLFAFSILRNRERHGGELLKRIYKHC